MRETSDALNLCRGETTTLLDLARTILEVAGENRPVHAPDTATHGVLARRSTNTAAARALRNVDLHGARGRAAADDRVVSPGVPPCRALSATSSSGRTASSGATSCRGSGRGREVVEIGRAAGDLSDWANVERALRDAPPAGRIFHVVTRQRTGAIQYDIQGELLAINTRIHLNVLEAWRLYQPQAKIVSTGSSCTYPESAEPLPEARFGQGPTHPSVIGYGLAKQVLATGSAAYAHQYGLSFLHCVLATLYGPHDNTASDRSHFVGALLDRAVREKAAGAHAFEVWGNPQTVREVLYVDDQIDAILAADRAFENEILNCGAIHPHHRRGGGAGSPGGPRLVRAPVSPPGSFQGAAYKMLDSTRFLGRTGWQTAHRSRDGPAQARRGGVRRALTSRIPDWTCLAGGSHTSPCVRAMCRLAGVPSTTRRIWQFDPPGSGR